MAKYTIDNKGTRIVDECRVCHKFDREAHRKHPTMCSSCGALYERFMKTGTKDSDTAARKLLAVIKPDQTDELYNKLIRRTTMSGSNSRGRKACKQCGRMLEMDNFRKYVPRGTGKYTTTVGRHTICMECERFNQTINNTYKRDTRSPEQEQLLEQAKALYKTLADRGLEPKGRYAADVLGISQTKVVDTTASYINMLMQEPVVAAAPSDLDQWLTCDLTEEPDYYEQVLNDLMGKYRPCKGVDASGQLVYDDTHKETLNEIIDRFSAYEDEYWAAH